eukprot:TRINITY_DN432_c0_g1_i27.p1 TRINITY_DN432_c0_g1~~TRINITY_DN432_c0_g1_i27.p1  ORF type:complete len:126 (-),score=38.72 TRINITY_DN432_c0_g1_i27:94-471(-)
MPAEDIADAQEAPIDAVPDVAPVTTAGLSTAAIAGIAAASAVTAAAVVAAGIGVAVKVSRNKRKTETPAAEASAAAEAGAPPPPKPRNPLRRTLMLFYGKKNKGVDVINMTTTHSSITARSISKD